MSNFDPAELERLLREIAEAATPRYLRPKTVRVDILGEDWSREILAGFEPKDVTRQALERADLFDAIGGVESKIRRWRCTNCGARYNVELGADSSMLEPHCPDCNGLLVFP